ncbi:hypothetical protein RJ640_020022 [Escallonia rubra]|uniref:Vacuolar cation/proton exchanger n=1 Tax=Escallonia rubra TaxID=112253 RepID=A0AA88UFE2_9ASTE|nr:hypothetical protein RJ640_020022 [Escallonia rubra]
MASMDNSIIKGSLSKENRHAAGRTPHNMSSSSLRKKSDLTLVTKVRNRYLRMLLANLQEVLLGTKLSVLFPAVALAIAAKCYNFGRISYFTSPTVGGLLNATCGNATELIIVIFALIQHKVDIVKYSLLGSILSELLLVLGCSLLCGGLVNLTKEQNFDKSMDEWQKQANVNLLLLLLALFCHTLPMMFRYAGESSGVTAKATLQLSRVNSIIMLIAYSAYLIFQLWIHKQFFQAQEEEDDDDVVTEESSVIGFWSGLVWLAGMTAVTALLSEYLVGTIEDASESWGLSVSFISIILLPFFGNAAEHAGAIVFAFKNKLDVCLGVAVGSATQVSMFVVPLSVILAWIMGIKMDLDLHLLETVSLALSIFVTAFTLQCKALSIWIQDHQRLKSSDCDLRLHVFKFNLDQYSNSDLML